MRRFTFLLSLILCTTAYADSKRIEVYSVSQAYVDVKRGDTLGEIVKDLLPNTPKKRKAIMKEIVEFNPNAFIDGDPNILKANTRLWLPGHVSGLREYVDRNKYHIKEYSWGYTKQAK